MGMEYGRKSVNGWNGEAKLYLLSAKGTILEVLDEVGNFDSDFSGITDEDYIWDAAIDNNFSSNKEYLLDIISGLNPKDAVEEFFNAWLEQDVYYTDYAYELIDLGNGNYYLTLAVVC